VAFIDFSGQVVEGRELEPEDVAQAPVTTEEVNIKADPSESEVLGHREAGPKPTASFAGTYSNLRNLAESIADEPGGESFPLSSSEENVNQGVWEAGLADEPATSLGGESAVHEGVEGGLDELVSLTEGGSDDGPEMKAEDFVFDSPNAFAESSEGSNSVPIEGSEEVDELFGVPGFGFDTEEQNPAFEGENFSDVVKFGNDEVSQAAQGPLLFRLRILGIDTSETRKSLRQCLDDERFLWDTEQLMRSIDRGVLLIDRVNPVKATVLVERLKDLSVEVEWEQYAISQI
jgi:hypothetical protein